MYLLTAAADLIRLNSSANHEDLDDTIERLWINMVGQKMYVTGGIGAMKKWEGFGLDYFLPQGTDEGGCYAETCAAIGVMMLAERRLRVSQVPLDYLPSWKASVLIYSHTDFLGRPLRRYHGALPL